MAIKVTLRQKPLKDGKRNSLYLDIYPAVPHPKTGLLSRRDFLKMYVYDKPRGELQKQHNAEQLKIAESIRQKKENILNKPEVYSEYEKEQLRIKELGQGDFVEYFRKLANKRSDSNHGNWVSALKHFEDFSGGSLKFADLNEHVIDEFKEYLSSAKSHRSKETSITQNTAVSYFNKVKATLNQAYKDGILQTDLNSRISPIKTLETSRQHLTLDEVNKLVKTACKDEVLKCAGLFACLTGLRFSDIEKLTWGEVEYVDADHIYLKFTQQKTKGVEIQPISGQAYELCGERRQSEDKVFNGLKYRPKLVKDWVKSAGITKEITFHCFRHTYATLQLMEGTDIYTVSKMLGHRDLGTTQIYAKIVDKTKQEAANRIILDM